MQISLSVFVCRGISAAAASLRVARRLFLAQREGEFEELLVQRGNDVVAVV
jgi:hypothetical protein